CVCVCVCVCVSVCACVISGDCVLVCPSFCVCFILEVSISGEHTSEIYTLSLYASLWSLCVCVCVCVCVSVCACVISGDCVLVCPSFCVCLILEVSGWPFEVHLALLYCLVLSGEGCVALLYC